MLVVIPVAKPEVDRALDLLQWMRELGSLRSHKLLLVTAYPVSVDDSMALAQIAGDVFQVVHCCHQKTESEHGWPKNANAMFSTAVDWLKQKMPESFLWQEVDAIPMREGWLDQIEAEYRREGKPWMGTIYDQPFRHFNGVMVYPANVANMNPWCCNASVRPFDLTRPEIALSRGCNTPLIRRMLANPRKNEPMSFPTVESLDVIPKECVLFHGNKDGTLIERLRDRKSGSLTGEYVTAFLDKPVSVGGTRLAIAGLLKGEAPRLAGMLSSMEPMFKQFDDVRGFFCVDRLDSASINTLRQWSKRLELPINVFQQPKVLPQGRYAKMATLRNAYLTRISDSGYQPDYLFAADMDIARFDGWSGLDDLLKDVTWSAAAMMGIRPKTELPHFHPSTEIQYKGKTYCYYDLLAFEDANNVRVLWHEGLPPIRWFWHGTVPDTVRFTNVFPLDPSNGFKATEVHSAFGPAAFYRWSDIKGFRYCEWAGECEHQMFHRELRKAGRKIILSPLIALYSEYATPQISPLSRITQKVKGMLNVVAG